MTTITPALERLILQGKAEYKTLSMAGFNEMILPVPDKTYVVILGYQYLPFAPKVGQPVNESAFDLTDISFLMQYLNFVTGSNFYPFAHALFYKSRLETYQDQSPNPPAQNFQFDRSDYDHQHRSTYIVAKQDVAIYATKMNTQPLIDLIGVIPQNGNITTPLGYAGVNALYGLQNYVDAAAGRLYPMTDKYTQGFLDPNPSRYNQAFTLFNGANPLDAYIDIDSFINNDYGKSRINHITLHYVKINQEVPETIF